MDVERLEAIRKEAEGAINQVADNTGLEQLRIKYLGKKGEVTVLLKQLGSLPPDDRSQFGQRLNHLKGALETLLEERARSLVTHSKGNSSLDTTLPGVQPALGCLHPITKTIHEICDIFVRLGFEVVEDREIETEFYNFTALNIPLDHPSRDAFNTFYTEQGHLLRSQTSTVQIRIMQNRKPPLRIVAPGRVYRPDEVDASHSFMFHQVEGLLVDRESRFSDLKGVLHHFLRQLFGSNIRIRFRPHYFPFTEPSVEVDVNWGKGWLELLGAGQVHPAVFKHVGYDPKKVQGFAFGIGVERVAMLKYGIQDIRLFFENDLRFLEQFA